MHWNFTNDDGSVSVNLAEHSNTGAVWGTVDYGGRSYPVTGFWQAKGGGGIEARKVSNLLFSGLTSTTNGGPDFIAASGFLEGEPAAVTGLRLVLNAASSRNGKLEQVQATLSNRASDPMPSEVQPPDLTGANMPWQLISRDGTVKLDVEVGMSGDLRGTLTFGHPYPVRGVWALKEGAPGRQASSLELTGLFAVEPGADNVLAATGLMNGLADAPQRVTLAGSVASISEPNFSAFEQELLPMWQVNPTELGKAYAESYMVLRIEGGQAVRGWYGPIVGGDRVSPFGSADYQSAGTALAPDVLAGLMGPDPTRQADLQMQIPAFNSEARHRPVMIQFVGDSGHFPQPPLMEYHEQITKIFYDEAAGALVLQFSDVARGPKTTPITFNHGRDRNHNSVIIEPR